MIDPVNITNFNQTTEQLEENLLFWICAAGHNALSSANALDRFLRKIHQNKKKYEPFRYIRMQHYQELPFLLRDAGIGCNGAKAMEQGKGLLYKARSFFDLSYSGLNLHTCSIEDLEKIYGIGMKTSRCFIMHSRRDARCAGLDTHVLKYLKDQGYDVPKSTPTKKEYLKLEGVFLRLLDQSKKPLSEFDLEIWKKYSGN